MRLNPTKYTFGDKTWKFLEFILTAQGIESNRNKYAIILNMRSSHNLKEVWRLIDWPSSLSISLPRLAEKIKSILNVVKKRKKQNVCIRVRIYKLLPCSHVYISISMYCLNERNTNLCVFSTIQT